MRILFVDDESSVLEGIENRLRRYRKRWDMNFSHSAKDALNKMANQSFDVVVSDMRMPEMDGAELLTRIREDYSSTLRIILTGQTAKEQILRSLSVAHRVLNKPCDAILLEAAIADAQSFHDLINNDGVRIHIDKLENLPSLPAIHARLTQLIKHGEAEIEKVSDLIQQDASIAARVLQLVNSSFIGLAREITSIRDAVSYLGLDCIRGLVLNIELFQFLKDKKLSPSFSFEKNHRRSLLCARIAKALTDNSEHAELVYSGALLHGIGQLVLAHILPDEYENVLIQQRYQKRPLVDVEADMLGFTHTDVNAYLLSLWDLPFSLINIVGHYAKPSQMTHDDNGPTMLVHAASALTAEQSSGDQAYGFDMDYLEQRHALDRIPHWKSQAEEVKNHAGC